MSGFPIIDLVVGMIFIFFLLSIMSSSVVEIIQTISKARAKVLEAWLLKIFDKNVSLPNNGGTVRLGQAIMDHCAAIALSEKGKVPSSYIDAKNFSTALLEKITYDPARPDSIAKNIQDVINALGTTSILPEEIKRALLGYAYEARDTYRHLNDKTISEVAYFRSKVENWYDSSMDRLTGSLKRQYTQPITFLVAVIITCLLNADSIAIAKYLYSNPEARAKAVQAADNLVNDKNEIARYKSGVPLQDTARIRDLQQLEKLIDTSVQHLQQARATLSGLIPLGWRNVAEAPSPTFPDVLSKIMGLLATVFAIFMGAPFWFDVLNKVANLRGTGPKPSSKTEGDFNRPK